MISWEILMFSWDFLTFSWYHQNITKAGDWSNSSIGRYSIANICIIILTHTIPSKNESNFMGSTNIFDIVGIPWMNIIFSIGFPQQHTILTTIDHSFWMSNSSRSNFQGLDDPLILTACQARVELLSLSLKARTHHYTYNHQNFNNLLMKTLHKYDVKPKTSPI